MSVKPATEATASAFRVTEAEFIAGATTAVALPAPVMAEVAFAGRSNVGKSSLLNSMMQRKALVRTSNTPGCTRQINVFACKLHGGFAVHLVDLPGYGYARLSKKEKSTWGMMLEGYLKTRATLRAVAVLVDIRRGIEDDDAQLLEFLTQPRDVETPKPVERIVIATKLDKLPLSGRKPALEALRKTSGVRVIGYSAVTGDGRDDLWKRMQAAVS